MNLAILVLVEYQANPVTPVKREPKVKLVRWVLKEESRVNLGSLVKTDLQVSLVHVVYLAKTENPVNVVQKVIKVIKDQSVHLVFPELPVRLANKVDKVHPVLLVQ